MSKITVEVPNGETCHGCDFIATSREEIAMWCSHTTHNCMIFKTEITDFNKCVGCKIMATNNKE